MPPHHAPEVLFVNEGSARSGERVPEDSLTIVLTDGADTQAHHVSEPMRVVGYVRRDAVPAEIAPLIAALAHICSRDPR